MMHSSPLIVKSNRLRVEISEPVEDKDISLSIDKNWHSVYGTSGIWRSRCLSKAFLREITSQAYDQLRQMIEHGEGKVSCAYLISRLLDAVHPSHQLQANLLANGGQGGLAILKKRAVALGYSVINPVNLDKPNQKDIVKDNQPIINSAIEDQMGVVDAKWGLMLVKQILNKFDKDLRFYFEFSSPDTNEWRVGKSILSIF